MKKRNLTLAAVAAAIALTVAPFVIAGERGHHRGHGATAAGGDFGPMMMFGHLGRVKAALDLSDAQIAQLKDIHVALREQNAPYRESLKGGFAEVAQALLANPNDVAGARALLDKHEAAERAMKLNALNAASKALNVLTPEQRAKAAQFVAERAARHRDAR